MKTPHLVFVFAASSVLAGEPDDAAARRHHQTAVRAYQQGELAGARIEWRKSLREAKRPSTRLLALYGLGRVSRDLGVHDDAFAAFEKVLTIDPGDVVAAFEIGRTAAICGCRMERGQEALTRYLLSARPVGDMPTRKQAVALLVDLEAWSGKP